MLDSLDTLIAFVLIMLVVSLLITIVVQMFAAALNLRGVNLISGLGSVIAIIDPSLEGQKTDLAQYLLRGRLLSDSFLPIDVSKLPKQLGWLGKLVDWLRPTSAARPQEIFDAIHRVAIGNEYKDPANPTSKEQQLVQSAQKVLAALGVRLETLPDALQATQIVGDTLNKALAELPDGRVKSEAQKALAQASAKLRDFETAAVRVGSQTVGDIDSAYRKFDYWVRIGQERADQWLTMHTRILTVVFAFFFAFWLQFDTVETFKLVSSNKTLRDKLVAQTGVTEAQAAKILGENNDLLKKAVEALSEKQKDEDLKAALAKIEVAINDTREQVRDKVTKALNGRTPAGSFDSSLTDIISKKLDKKAGDFKEVKTALDNTGFQLFPDSRKGRWGKRGGWFGWPGSRGHRWGILFSVGLLSLGAPFWYHSLKDLVSLRSQVAQNISQEQEQAQKKPMVPSPPQAPPTVKA